MNLESLETVFDFFTNSKNHSIELASFSNSVINNETPDLLSIECIQEAIKYGILKRVSGNLEFASNQILNVFYIVYIVESKTIKFSSNEEWCIFLSNLNNVQYRNVFSKIGYGFEKISHIVSNRLFRVDITEIVKNAPQEKRNFIYHIYTEIFPYIVAPISNLIDGLLISTKGMKAEGNYITLNQAVVKLSKQNINFGFAIVESTKENFEQSKLLCPFALLGISEAIGIKGILPLIEKLLKASDLNSRKIGLLCLGRLNGDNHKFDVFEKQILSLLEGVEREEVLYLGPELVILYGLLIDKLTLSRQKLIDIPRSKPDKENLLALAYVVNITIDKEFNQKWLKISLSLLSKLDNQYPATYSHIRWALYAMCDSHPEIIFDYIESFISHEENDIKNIEAFKSIFETLVRENFTLIQKWVTIWFNSDNYRFHLALREILSIISLSDKKELMLDETSINCLTEFDIEYILYKIVGYTYTKEYLVSLVYSTLFFQGKSQLIKQIVTELFCYYIVYNYPSTLKYLTNKKISANKYQKEVIESVEEYYERVYSARQVKPKELAPSPERLQSIFNQQISQLNSYEKTSPFKEASFLDFVSKVNIKIGNSFFSRNDFEYGTKQQYSNKSTMGHFSHTMEYPSGEFLDPVGQEYNRYEWRKFKRRKQ